MSDFLKELEELFNTFKEDELKHLHNKSKNHESLFEVLQSSEFFMKEYIEQQFKRSKRFKEKTYYNFKGYPVKLNTTKEMRLNSIYKIKKYDKNGKREEENFSFDKLKSSPIKVNELVLFTEGSRTKTQFECWTPMEMFLWWRTLRESGDPKGEWKIMDAVFFLFINQISQIINTYVINFYLNFYQTIIKKYEKDYHHNYIRIYKIKRHEEGKNDIANPYLKSLFYLKKYLEELDKFYKSGGEYGLLLDVQLLYYEYYEFELYLTQLRHDDNDNGKVRLLKKNNNINNLNLSSVFFNKRQTNKYKLTHFGYRLMNSRNFKNALTRYANLPHGNKYDLKKIFAKTLEEDNFILIIFQSYFQNSSKFISLYSIPVIPILGIEYDTHDGETYSSLQHVQHDLFHAVYLLYFLNNILYHPKFSKNSNEDIQEFFKRTVFLEELNKKASNKKASNKNNNEHSIYKDSQKLLWWILHEKNFSIDGGGTFNMTPEKSYRGPAAKNFFYIDKLKELLNELNKYTTEHYRKHNSVRISNCISKLIEICDFVLGQKLRYNNRNKNNNRNNRGAVYGDNNNNNNNFRKSVEKPSFNSITREKFYGNALGNTKGSPLTNNNFSNQNTRHTNNT